MLEITTNVFSKYEEVLEPAKLGARIAGRSLIDQYSAWEHAWSDAHGDGKGLGGMLQTASCFKNSVCRLANATR